MESLNQYLPFLIPIIVLQYGLLIGALVHLLKRKRTRNLNVAIWAIIIILFGIIGPALYFLIGREED